MTSTWRDALTNAAAQINPPKQEEENVEEEDKEDDEEDVEEEATAGVDVIPPPSSLLPDGAGMDSTDPFGVDADVDQSAGAIQKLLQRRRSPVARRV